MTFLNKKQIKILKGKEWNVVPDCAHVSLYPDDFGDNDSWEQICDQVNLPCDVEEIQIVYVGVQTNF